MKGHSNVKIFNDSNSRCYFYRRLLFIALISLTGCNQSDGDLEGSIDRTKTLQEIRIHVYDTAAEMQKALVEKKGTKRSRQLLGWSLWSDTSLDFGCEIHVVKARNAEDSRFKTWGHELAHCLYGTYHEEL